MLFYRLAPDVPPEETALADLRRRQEGYDISYWQPRAGMPFAPGTRDPRVWSYSIMHAAGMFATPHYGALILRGPDGAIDHSSLVMPRFARFPFMGANDLQIGATFTRPAARGRGLALRAIHEIVSRLGEPGRAFWYLTDVTNRASIGVVEKAGFQLVGTGEKKARMGLKFFGFYDISAPAEGRSAFGSGRSTAKSRSLEGKSSEILT
jgi:RimJ/RimL family protein N-acetyltransferase